MEGHVEPGERRFRQRDPAGLACEWKGLMKKSRCGKSEDQIDKPQTDMRRNSTT